MGGELFNTVKTNFLEGLNQEKNDASELASLYERIRQMNSGLPPPMITRPGAKPVEVSPMDKWRNEIDTLISSKNPRIQRIAMDMLLPYRNASIPSSGSMPSAINEYQYAVSQGYKGTFADWKRDNKASTTINMGGDSVIKPSDTPYIHDAEGNPVKVPAGTTWGEASSRGWVLNKPKTDTGVEKGASTDLAIKLASQLQELVDKGVDVYGVPGILEEVRGNADAMGVITDSILNMLGSPTTPQAAQAASVIENLGNIVLQAARGASVGPEEQKKFERSLPRLGQPREVFMANLKQTLDNLQYLQTLRNPLNAPTTGKPGASDIDFGD